MEFINIVTEQTTAVTDAVLAIMAIVFALQLDGKNKQERYKVNLWKWFFSLLSLASILGFIAHGFKMPEATQALYWHPLNLALGLLIGVFFVAATYDVFSESIAKKILPVMMVIGFGFFALTLAWPDSFLVFIIYELIIMIFALSGYSWLAYRKILPGSWVIASGIFTTIIAAGLQAIHSLSFTFVWVFDHNGIYHLVQMIGLVLLFNGIKKTLNIKT